MAIFPKRQNDREKWGERLPPGQKDTGDGWPILHYGGVPKIDPGTWRFEIGGLVEAPLVLTWDEFLAIGEESRQNDIHCVTAWSKFDNVWEGVPVLEVMKRVKLKPEAKHVMVHSFGGYTTNIPIDDLLRPENLFATRHNGQPLQRDHGGPMRLVVPHLYFWKSAKWARGLVFLPMEQPGFWEMYGYHIHGDPWKEERYS